MTPLENDRGQKRHALLRTKTKKKRVTIFVFFLSLDCEGYKIHKVMTVIMVTHAGVMSIVIFFVSNGQGADGITLLKKVRDRWPSSGGSARGLSGRYFPVNNSINKVFLSSP